SGEQGGEVVLLVEVEEVGVGQQDVRDHQQYLDDQESAQVREENAGTATATCRRDRGPWWRIDRGSSFAVGGHLPITIPIRPRLTTGRRARRPSSSHQWCTSRVPCDAGVGWVTALMPVRAPGHG